MVETQKNWIQLLENIVYVEHFAKSTESPNTETKGLRRSWTSGFFLEVIYAQNFYC